MLSEVIMTTKESDLFINEFLMGLSAQEYVAKGLALINSKSFVVSFPDDNDK